MTTPRTDTLIFDATLLDMELRHDPANALRELAEAIERGQATVRMRGTLQGVGSTDATHEHFLLALDLGVRPVTKVAAQPAKHVAAPEQESKELARDGRALIEAIGALYADTRYLNGRTCTWHGPLAETLRREVDVTTCSSTEPESVTLHLCPICSGGLNELQTEDDFWAMVRSQERNLPGYEAMLRWSRGKCFPDFDTLQNTYRQAMEGQS